MFGLNDNEVRTKPGRAPAKPTDKHLPIFERMKGRTVDFLKLSIVEGKGRFHGEGSGAYGQDHFDTDKAKASPCWKVHKANEKNPGQNELVHIGIPCGNKFMVWFKDDKGEPTGQPLVDSTIVVSKLTEWLADFEGLTKDSKEGKEFWEHSVENAEPPKQKGLPDSVKSASDFLGQTYSKAEDKWIDTPANAADKKERAEAKKEAALLAAIEAGKEF
jgi:hypothetical protein